MFIDLFASVFFSKLMPAQGFLVRSTNLCTGNHLTEKILSVFYCIHTAILYSSNWGQTLLACPLYCLVTFCFWNDLSFLSMSTQSFKINGNLIGIYTPIIHCTKFIQTSLHFLRYLTHLLEKNKPL